MGLFDRFGRRQREAVGPAPDPVMPSGGDADARAIDRYRYLLRTAPPEAIEQAHAEAFAQLTAEQRRKVLEQLRGEISPAEQAALTREGVHATALARAATRAEMRRPGTMERLFGGATPGLGGLMAGTMLSTMAGMVLGSVVAQHFLHDHAAGAAGDAAAAPAPGDAGDNWVADDASFGDFDGGSFDV